MTRIFDSKKSSAPRAPKSSRDEARAALAAADLDGTARKLGELLGSAQAVQAIRYARERRGRWMIEHGRAGDDYVLQLHPLKPTRPWNLVIPGFIAALDGIFPRSVQIYYRRPDEQWQVRFFTVKVENVCRLPGWEPAATRAVDALAAVDAWSAATTPASGDRLSSPGKRGSDEGPG